MLLTKERSLANFQVGNEEKFTTRSPFTLGQTWQGCECVFVDPGSHGLWIHVSEHQTHPCSGQNRCHTANPRGIGVVCISASSLVSPGAVSVCGPCVWWPFVHHFWASNKSHLRMLIATEFFAFSFTNEVTWDQYCISFWKSMLKMVWCVCSR